MASNKKAEALLAERMMGFADDPLGWVLYSFPWGQPGPLENYPHPRKWQIRVLDEMGTWIRGGGSMDVAFRMAVKSGHGPGKSALIAMVVMWGMSTMQNTNIVVTANTENQLLKKTWPELAKWYRMAINAHWFKFTATSLAFNDDEVEKTWRADAIPWSETNPEAFAGLHNEGRRIIVIFDEASAIADKIWEVTEGALTDENTEIIWLAFGNPTRNTGMFKACFGRFRHVWRNLTVDTRNVEGINKKQIDNWIRDYGLQSDFVRVRVLGQFPMASQMQFISEELVQQAMKVNLPKSSYDFAPVVIGVDPAWTGEDSMEIVARQGMKAWGLSSIPKNDDDVAVANLIAKFADQLSAAAIFVDGGFGTGIHSILKNQGRPSHLVWFGSKAIDPQYMNKRVEMWGGTKAWLKVGGDIPDMEDWRVDLCSVQDKPDSLSGKSRLESKEDMRKRGEASPGKGDALALTFAMNITSDSDNKMLDNLEYESDWD